MKVGDIYRTNNCGDCEVVEYKNPRNVVVRFVNTGFVTTVMLVNLRSGKIKDLLCPSVFGVGFIGAGAYSKTMNKDAYQTWQNMLSRCYNEKHQKNNKSYIGCTVCRSWMNFQVFAEWYYKNHPNDGEDYQLDKDLKIIGNRIYSENTCLFVPHFVNKFITDSGATRGNLMIGVSWKKDRESFQAHCRNPKSNKKEYLGYFKSELEAHMAWRKRKFEVGIELANIQSNYFVKQSIVRWCKALQDNKIHPLTK